MCFFALGFTQAIIDGLNTIASTSTVVSTTLQRGLNLAQQTAAAHRVQQIGNFVSSAASTTAFVIQTGQQTIDQLKGSTTNDDVAAADARASNAPNSDDLQGTIAPQLTTSGTDAEVQPEIAQGEEQTPRRDLPFVADLENDIEIVDLDVSEDEAIEIDEILDIADKISKSFVIEFAAAERLKKYCKQLSFTYNQNWIGKFYNPIEAY